MLVAFRPENFFTANSPVTMQISCPVLAICYNFLLFFHNKHDCHTTPISPTILSYIYHLPHFPPPTPRLTHSPTLLKSPNHPERAYSYYPTNSLDPQTTYSTSYNWQYSDPASQVPISVGQYRPPALESALRAPKTRATQCGSATAMNPGCRS